MKKYFLLLFLLFNFFIIKDVYAMSYEEVDQSVLQYNISNFLLKNENIILNGWAVTDNHQNLTGNETHEYSLLLVNKETGEELIYNAELKSVDKTRLMKASEETEVCSNYFDGHKCYYKYTKVGFEFSIPIKDLEDDAEYSIKLRIYEKLINKRYQLSIYALAIDNLYEYKGVKYQLYSDIKKTSIDILEGYLYVRSGPGQNYSIRQSSISCYSGKSLYWYPYGKFTTVLGAKQNNPGSIDSELWVNMKYKHGECNGGKARAVNGTDYDGWAPWVYMQGSGEPAIIKTSSLESFSIEELRTYTTSKNNKNKVLLTLNSIKEETVIVKAYHNNNLVYNKQHTVNGKNSFDIGYVIKDNGNIIVEVIGQYKTKKVESKVYISSEEVYEIVSNNEDRIIEVNTPIIVITDKNGISKEYKEKVKLSAIPYELEISQGRGLNGVISAITYWYPLEEFSLNQDYSVYALYPSKEETQNYEIIDGKVKVNLIKDAINRKNDSDIAYFYHPDAVLSLIEGNLYNELQNNYYNGGTIWYPSWNDEIGTYEYTYIGSNLGINKITIKRNLNYTITSTMFGNENGKFIIKRVEIPDNIDLIYKRKFTLEELLEYGRVNR